MPQSESQTTAVAVADLRRVLRVVLPHVAHDPVVPFLGDVEVTLSEHALTLAATDRFTLAAARAELPESAPSIHWANTVAGRHLATLARLLPRTKASNGWPVVITATEANLRITVPTADPLNSDEQPAWTVPATNNAFIAWRPMLDKALNTKAKPGAGQACVNPSLMARWTHLAERHEPIRIVIASDTDPIVLLTKGAVGIQGALRLPNFGRETVRALSAPWSALAAA